MSKIAFITNWISFTKKDAEELKRERSHVDPKFIIESLFKTSKKYFLPNHEVDFIFITNTEIKIDNIKTIKIDLKIKNFWHACLMKILSVKFIEEKYDYYFINDTDQIFIDYIDDSILKNNFVVIDHWSQSIKNVSSYITKSIPLDFDENKKLEKWVLGNFFGGKREYIFDLVNQTENTHLKYYKDTEEFYIAYPEEFYLVKYLYENNIVFKRLLTSDTSTEEKFMYCFNETNAKLLINNNHVPGSTKLLHDTKSFYPYLIKIMKNYE